uniref:hypothetical protein n=1 Tax=Herbidospora sakaeratensis TaxID=564415 RepID=UPI0007820E88|nr:hypothetical protein [Herbidospora sakaeratensis]
MNDVISRLKDATTAVGDTISEVPPLRLERVRKGFVAPLAAALAVGLAIVGSVVMTRGGLSQIAVSTAAPRFIVEAADPSALIVRSAGDGAELDRVEGATGWFYHQVQAAPDNRTFYASQGGPVLCSSRIVRFTVDEEGRAGTLAEVPVDLPDRTRISAFAVSGDGTKVILGAAPCVADGSGSGFLVVADPETGEGRRLQVGARSWFGSISTSEDGSKIAYTTMAAGHQVTVSEPAVIVAPPSGVPTPLPGGGPPDVVLSDAPTPFPSATPSEVVPPDAPTPLPSSGPTTDISAATGMPIREPAAVVSVPPGVPTPLPGPGPAVVTATPSAVLTPVPSVGAPEKPVAVPVPTYVISDPGPSGNVVVVVPSAGPSPSGNIVVYPAPTDVSPTLGTLEGVSSCRFFALRENLQIPADQLRMVDCADSPEVYVVDADRPGEPPRRTVLSGELDGAKVQFYGVRMSPDGTRLIAGVSTGLTRLDDPQAAIMAFDPAGREPVEVLYRGRAWLRVLDLAAGGSRILVQSEMEIGEVSENAYRKVMDIPGRVMNGVVAW